MSYSARTTSGLPRTLDCPRCTSRMNLTGPGRAAGSVIYFCGSCAPAHRVRELWQGKILRTGTRGFGFIALSGPQELDPVHFRDDDCLSPSRGGDRPAGKPHVGASVLVLLGDDASNAARVWLLVAASPQPSRPERRSPGSDRARSNGQHSRVGRPVSGQSGASSNGSRSSSEGSSRRRGSIVRLGGPDWGFISEYGTGHEVFVHRSQWRGRAVFAPGLPVTYQTVRTEKGERAQDVEPLRRE